MGKGVRNNGAHQGKKGADCFSSLERSNSARGDFFAQAERGQERARQHVGRHWNLYSRIEAVPQGSSCGSAR